MQNIFSKWQISSLTVNNRIVRSATWEGAATAQGDVTDKLVQYYHDLAKGGVGLIISGYMYIQPDGIGLSYQTGIYSDDQIEGIARLAGAAHDDDAIVFSQIVHCGGQVRQKLLKPGRVPLAPSKHYFPVFKNEARAMTKKEIKATVIAFAEAARRARAAGFDGVQIHGAHGYLLNQFFSDHTNQRTDEYGGNLENRFRFAKEVVQSIRSEVGRDYPLGVKLNSEDLVDGGLTVDEAVQVAQWFESSGINFIEISGGVPEAGELGTIRSVDKGVSEAYFLKNARKIKQELNIPVVVVGGWRSPEGIERAIGAKEVDAVSLSRPFIAEPGLVARWRDGDLTPARCISCNGCFAGGFKGKGIFCVQMANNKI